jgi:hypothetical protein
MNKLLVIAFLCLCCKFLTAQTLPKEALNNFARYTQDGKFEWLEKSRKNIDEAYKTPKDSANYKINLIRGMVYSSLAYADSTRKLKYLKDPLDEAVYAVKQLKNTMLNSTHQPELEFIKKTLAQGWLNRANRALFSSDYHAAYKAYLWADSLNSQNFLAKHNLALLSEKLGYPDKAITYYQHLITDKNHSWKKPKRY